MYNTIRYDETTVQTGKSIFKQTRLFFYTNLVNILSGSWISLFNRINSQTGTTKFFGLTPNGKHFSSSNSSWDPFRIWIVDDIEHHLGQAGLSVDSCNRNENMLLLSPKEKEIFKNTVNQFAQQELLSGRQPRTVQYGNRVVLQHFGSGKVTVPFTIRLLNDPDLSIKKGRKKSKVDKSFRCERYHGNNYVSQLQKIGLQFDDQYFLSFQNGQFQRFASIAQETDEFDLIKEHAVWGIVGVGI